jgi:hypothetical protein
MESPSKNSETSFRELINGAGLSLPKVIDTLNGKLLESKMDLAMINSLLDAESKIAERVKVLELELFIGLLKKI